MSMCVDVCRWVDVCSGTCIDMCISMCDAMFDAMCNWRLYASVVKCQLWGGFMKHVSKLFLFSTSRTGLRRSYNFIYHFNNRFSKFFSNRFSNQSLQQACHWRCKNKKKASCLLLFKRRMTHIKAARLVRRHQWHKQWHQQSHLKQQKTTRAYRSSTTLRNRGQRNDRFRWRA